MATHSYGLRSRLNGQSPSLRTPTTGSPLPKPAASSPRRTRPWDVSLHLQRVIGTTTKSPTGLSCCPAIDSYAYCAGAVVVLARVEDDGSVSHRYYKARPTVLSLNPPTSHYETHSPAGTPSKRRTSSVFTSGYGGRDDHAGASFGREWLDETSGQTWTARERIKAATCVSLSQDGRWLAVGESGYSPRVLLFSLAPDASAEIPTSIVSDHTFGVRSVAFSPDSKYLATLGNLHDGYLFIWSVNPKNGALTLHSANKCTTNICDMTWCGGSLITVGTRHIKVWQVAEPIQPSPPKKSRFRASGTFPASPGGPRPLQGRNCLLGPMVDATFTCITALDHHRAAVCTETGDLCVVEISPRAPEVKVLKHTDFPITSIAFRSTRGQLLLGSSRGLHPEDLSALQQAGNTLSSTKQTPPRSASRASQRSSSIRRSLGLWREQVASIVAVGSLTHHTVILDSQGNLQLDHTATDARVHGSPVFASHNEMIQGVQLLPPDAELGDFFTWSKTGELKFWSMSGTLFGQVKLDVDQPELDDENGENELKTVRFDRGSGVFLTGDRFGFLKTVRHADQEVTHAIRAHGAEITDIILDASRSLVATASRDRMVQLFHIRSDQMELVQTMDDHVGVVSQVLFVQEAEKLLSCSSDRSVVIRDRVVRSVADVETAAYLTVKVVTLKATPQYMTIPAGMTDLVFVSTMDRKVVKVEPSSGAILDSVKLADPDNDDAVVLNRISSTQMPGRAGDDGDRLLVGYSSMDKSIRVYNEGPLVLWGRESGHTEGISDMALVEPVVDDDTGMCRSTVISTGLDGTIMLWSISKMGAAFSDQTTQQWSRGLGTAGDGSEETAAKTSPLPLLPLRKVLTKSDILELTRGREIRSPSSPRSLSPVRLKRKTSKLALSATTIDEDDEAGFSSAANNDTDTPPGQDFRPSSSPPAQGSSRKPRKQRSRLDLGGDLGTRRSRAPTRSPSPPSTPRPRQPPNNSRLRRPPSVPTDLRAYALTQGRRSSMSQTSDFGSVGMATEQACRMLRTYRKKLLASREKVDLDELEEEAVAVLNVIRERKDRTLALGRRGKDDVDQLAVLLERTGMKDATPPGPEQDQDDVVTAINE